MKKLTRLEKYHQDYVSQRYSGKVVAVTAEALEIEHRARSAGSIALQPASGFSALIWRRVKLSVPVSWFAVSSAYPGVTMHVKVSTAGSVVGV